MLSPKLLMMKVKKVLLSLDFCCCCATVGRKRKQTSVKADEQKVVQTVMSKVVPTRGGRGRSHGRGRGHRSTLLHVLSLFTAQLLLIILCAFLCCHRQVAALTRWQHR